MTYQEDGIQILTLPQGIYVGVQGYPGMGDPKDSSILLGTTLRGVQPTDDHGIASFDSLFPGHYTGRATHIHGKPHRPTHHHSFPPPQRKHTN